MASPELARTILVDVARVILESDLLELPRGASLDRKTWAGRGVCDAIDVLLAGSDAPTVARDEAHGASWIFTASEYAGKQAAFRVVAVDATLAVEEDRAKSAARLVHTLRNVIFAVLSNAEAIEVDEPSGNELRRHLGYIKSPAQRVATVMQALAASVARVTPERAPIAVCVIVDLAIAQCEETSRPSRASVDDALLLDVDAALIADAICAMLTGEPGEAPELEISRAEPGFAEVAVVRNVTPGDAKLGDAIWSAIGVRTLEDAFRLSRARAIIVAHGGRVGAETVSKTRARLLAWVPISGARSSVSPREERAR